MERLLIEIEMGNLQSFQYVIFVAELERWKTDTMTEDDLQERTNNRIENLRELAAKQTEAAFEHREKSDYDGEGEFDDHEKKARTLFSMVHDYQERTHELCKLSDRHEFGEHELEEADLAGGA